MTLLSPFARRFGEGMEDRGRQHCGRNHGLLPPPLLFLHMGGRRLLHTVREAARRKKPQPGTVGVGTDTLPPLSLERTSQRYVGQVSWLAAFPYSLHLPKAKHPSGLCRFRSAYSCGAAMGLHHLPWSQAQTVTSPTSGICNSVWEHTVGPADLSRIFLSEKKSILAGTTLL